MARTSRYLDKSISKLNLALYVRLSEEDGDGKISESVKSQKSMLENFTLNMQNVNNYNFYVDDGYTGGNFDRPAFRTMINDILAKKINCVIVKDLSRFGRNYTEVSNYLQVMFPTLEVRFIAINDNIDSELNPESVDALLIGLSGLMNEEYLKDCSIKSKMSYHLRQSNGLFTSPIAPYGYKRDESDIHKLVVDDKVKDIVKFIFNDFIKRQSYTSVTKDLCEMQIPSPSEYKQSQNSKYFTNRQTNKQYIWSSDTVTTILKNMVYIGNMVQHKREIIDYKTKKCKKLPKDKWVIIENTHEPIIDKSLFDEVQSIINSKRNSCFQRKHKSRNDNYFSGLVICGNCKTKMSFVDDKNRKYTFYKCKLKALSSNLCNQEIIKTSTLTKVVLQVIQKYIKIACDIESILSKLETYQQGKIIAFKEKPQDIELQKRLLYEKYKNEEISLVGYKKQKEELENFKPCASKKDTLIKESEFVKNFIKLKNIKELSKELVKSLIDKIIVYSETNIEIQFKFQDEFERIVGLISQE